MWTVQKRDRGAPPASAWTGTGTSLRYLTVRCVADRYESARRGHCAHARADHHSSGLGLRLPPPGELASECDEYA